MTAPVPSGEVETPCATCGGNRKVRTGALSDFLEFGTQMPCPDCGVETPAEVCGQLHPENRRRCQLFLAHDEIAHSWERHNAAGNPIEHYEWLGDDER